MKRDAFFDTDARRAPIIDVRAALEAIGDTAEYTDDEARDALEDAQWDALAVGQRA